MADSLKEKSIVGVLWSFVEKISLQVIHFVISVILARILMPEDYGVIAIINIFLVFSQLFIDGGFTTALIQKKDRDYRDISTVYIFNIIISILIYTILFSTANYIAYFFQYKDLGLYIRVLSIVLIIASFSSVHKTQLIINIDFKTISKITIFSLLISGTVGVCCAYSRFGVWSLIIQYLINSCLNTILLRLHCKQRIGYVFDKERFSKLFSFSYKLVFSSLIDRIYYSLYPIFISKLFTSTKLGYYTRADQFAALPSSTCTDILLRVSFPVMSKITDEKQLLIVYRKYIYMSSFIVFPIVLIVLALSEPIILLLLTSKWAFSIRLLQILCIGYIFDHICAINRNLLYVKGRSDLALKLEIIKKATATLILIISALFHSLYAICIGKVVYDILAVFFNAYYTYDLIGLKLSSQFKDFSTSLIAAVFTCFVTLLVISYFSNSALKFTFGIICFISIYLLISLIINRKILIELFLLIKNYINR